MATINDLADATAKWVKQPFTSDMDLLHWFLIVGTVIVSAILWGIILRHMGE